MHENCSKIMLKYKYPYLCFTLSSTPIFFLLLEGTFSLEKMKIKMADSQKHVTPGLEEDTN